MRKCIYCLEEKPISAFNAEHVINKAFGTYGTDTPTLQCVCKGCNQILGDTVDLSLARGTFEAMTRIQRVVKKRKSVQIADANSRLEEILLAMPGPLDEILLDFILSENGEVKVFPKSQIGFRLAETKKWLNFTLDVFMNKGKPDLPKCDKIRMFGNSVEELQILRDKVAEYEIPVKDDLEIVPPPADEVWVDIHWYIKENIRRSIAKIAFNYLAFVRGSDFVLNPVFNVVREFIRYGRGHCLDFVRVSASRMTGADEYQDCHFVGIEMKKNSSLIAYTSLFNSFIYIVQLTKKYPIWHRFSQGHCFDPVNNTANEFLVTSLWIPPWITQQEEAPPKIRKLNS